MPTKTRSQHTIYTRDGARAVDTLACYGLYAVHRTSEHVMAHPVVHTPTGLMVGAARTLKAARALAAHFHEVAGDAGSGWAFGTGPAFDDTTDPAFARITKANDTRPRLN
jgi:hypothetical protein